MMVISSMLLQQNNDVLHARHPYRPGTGQQGEEPKMASRRIFRERQFN